MKEFIVAFLSIVIYRILTQVSQAFSNKTMNAVETFSPDAGPYRTASPVTQQPIEQPKPKREFKMPEIKLSNSVKTFLMLLPVCVCMVVIGCLYDMTFPSLGIRTGIGFATGLVGIFFVGATLVHLNQ